MLSETLAVSAPDEARLEDQTPVSEYRHIHNNETSPAASHTSRRYQNTVMILAGTLVWCLHRLGHRRGLILR